MDHNRLVGKAVVMEKVGNPVPARLLYLLIVVREFLEEFVFSSLQHSFYTGSNKENQDSK